MYRRMMISPLNFSIHWGNDADALKVVEEGIANLKQCAPFVVALNQEFKRIDIKSSWRNYDFQSY